MRNERGIVFLVGAVQFVNILDFMMVMPLGPDFSVALGIPTSHLGYIAGSYTAAAAVSGIAGSFFLDRFDRRSALAVAMLGLVLGTAMGGFATGLPSLIFARIVAGVFGGPATSISLSIIADVIPPERRGKALGAVMGAFSVASVLGVPAGLELASRGGWTMPFFAVAGLGAVLGALAIFLLPPLRIHLEQRDKNQKDTTIVDLISRRVIVVSYLLTAVTMCGIFILVPNISPFVQHNLGYPRESLGLLYLVGGAVSFFTMRFVGPLVDRFGAWQVGSIGVVMIIGVTWFGFYLEPPLLPAMGMFVGMMFSTSFRGVAYNALTSRVPRPHERARFMSFQSAVQHMASATGGFVSAQLLTERPDLYLEGMPRVAMVAIVLTLFQPILLFVVQGMVERNEPSGIPRELAGVRARND